MSTPTPKEIREKYSDYRNEWQPTRDEGSADMQAISTLGPWTASDRAAREDAARPCIHLDQINQYLHQYTGNLRKTKRAIQVTPKGNGANDQDAAKRSSVIRGIEDKSNAPTAVYIPAAESAAQRSYGFSVIRTEYKDDSSFDQEILVKPIANPDCVLISPYYKQPNACDIEDAFLLDIILKKDFESLYPDAEITDFEGEAVNGLNISDWVKTNYIVRAEYWKIEKDIRTLLLLNTPQGQKIVFKDELTSEERDRRYKKLKLHDGFEVVREREVQIPRVVQYMTNGVEILDEIPWAGSRIPIISCLGPERWTTEGGSAKRTLLSLVRFARDPQMLFDFLASQEAEEAGLVPKVPFVGASGQFETDRETWTELNKVPHPFVEYDAITDATGQNALPPPSRPQYEANFQQYELAKDSTGRSLQAAMGISPLPTAAQRANQKSGVALEKIQNEEDIGTQAFLDNFENGYLHNLGWQINELITPIMDTQREMPVAQPDGTRSTLHIVGNTSHPMGEDGAYNVQGLPDDHLHTGKGDFDLTIASGPSYDSEREMQDDFVDTLIQNMANLPQPGTPAAKVFALGIRMRPELGPIAKEIADVFDPPPTGNLPPEAQAAITQLQGQMQGLQQENAALHADRAGRVLEQQTKLTIQQMKNESDEKMAQLSNDIKVLIAEVQAKSQDSAERIQMFKEFWLENHGAAHEAALQASDQQHAKETAAATMAAQQQQAAQEQQQEQNQPAE
ncbi:MAG TPA: hypothetical protein VGG46_04030 [Terriglobales bacterium]|jgi:hypothetical protein